MPASEQNARRIETDGVFIGLLRLNEAWIVITVSILRSHYAVCQIHRQAVGVYINQFRCKVGVGRTRCRPQLQDYGTRHLNIFLKRRRLVDQNILPTVQWRLIPRGRLGINSHQAHHRISGVVVEPVGRSFGRFRDGEHTVAAHGVSGTVAVQEKFSILCASQGPLVLKTPPVLTHNK